MENMSDAKGTKCAKGVKGAKGVITIEDDGKGGKIFSF